MSLINDLLKLIIPERTTRSIARRGTKVARSTLAHASYEADKQAFNENALQQGNRTTSAVFDILPSTLEELLASPYNNLMTPMNTASLYVVALNAFSKDREQSLAMINYLRGPLPLNEEEVAFIDERMALYNEEGYLTRSYLLGAIPYNGYMPQQPFTINVTDNFYTYYDNDYATVYVYCSSENSSRPVYLRKLGELWYLSTLSLLDEVVSPA